MFHHIFQYALPVLPSLVSSTQETHAQANVITNSFQHASKAKYPDSDATNHFSQGPPLGNGTQPYLGTCNVQVANGTYLDNSIGTSVTNTSSKPLVLHNLLYTPLITKNLFPVS